MAVYPGITKGPKLAAIVTAVTVRWIAARVVDYKRLRDVVLCDAIPKTASGKILRRTLRA